VDDEHVLVVHDQRLALPGYDRLEQLLVTVLDLISETDEELDVAP